LFAPYTVQALKIEGKVKCGADTNEQEIVRIEQFGVLIAVKGRLLVFARAISSEGRNYTDNTGWTWTVPGKYAR